MLTKILKNPPPRLSDSFTFLNAFAIIGRVELIRETYFIIYLCVCMHTCVPVPAHAQIL